MSKKMQFHCKISNYLEQEDKELYEILNGLCVIGGLIPRGNTPGITFLLPDEKAYREEIFSKARGSDIADVNAATDMLNALILRDCYKSPADFSAKKDDIPNSLHPSQALNVESTTASEVVFAGGARAVLDAGFKSSSRKDNLSVWRIKKGRIPVTKDQPSSGKYSKAKASGKTGGYDVQDISKQTLRWKIAVAIENSFAMEQIQMRNDPSTSSTDAFYRAISSLCEYAQTVEPQRLQTFYAPLQSTSRLDFYILLEPHKQSGEYLLSDSTIAGWWNAHKQGGHSGKFVDLGWRGPPGLEAAVSAQRISILQDANARPRSAAEIIERVYLDLAKTNSIGACRDIYPPELHSKMAAEPQWKLALDECRYVVHQAFQSLCSAHEFDAGKYNEVVNLIGDLLQTGSSPKLLNKFILADLIAPREKIEEIKIFVSSTCFLYFPMGEEMSASLQNSTVHKPASDDGLVYNIDASGRLEHRRIFAESAERDAKIAQLLREIDSEGVSPALRAKISSILQK